ncbi:GntR family transcriptional regulator [Ktedonosporobacter rubrisoli]|uniref:GntR family transcriptional regulator n=2 Tax=Ktedonosporobacter rubrisoli TaxID=2509675 RepID=A0A4P6K5F9_KTERU|nr:GntR family transcriptional regulator [Ktedonosporobacter rubrisoli]
MSKQERAYSILRERIFDGTYSAGHRLVIDALARELGMSQVPIREALRRLEAEGWVIYQRNIGLQVAPPDPGKWEEQMVTLALLEGGATALAAPHLGAEGIGLLYRLNTEMQKALHTVDVLSFSRFNEEFHGAIYERCPNTYLVELLQETMNRLAMMRRTVFLYIPERGWASIQEHTNLIRLLEEHAPAQEIELAAREHKLHTIEAYKHNKDHFTFSPDVSLRG